MTCGDGPAIDSECTNLKKYYKQWYQTGCKNKNTCKTGWRRYHRYKDGCWRIGYDRNCCAPDMPPVYGPTNFQCCTGNTNNPNGYCNVDYCPYSSSCNQYMERVCPITVGPWATKGLNCTTYVTGAKEAGSPKAGLHITQKAIKNFFPLPYSREQVTNTVFPLRVEAMRNACEAYPGQCNGHLRKWCEKVTRQDVAKNKDLLTLCGCFMPDDQYPYSGLVDRPCAMTCNNGTAIQKGSSDSDKCGQTVCIIDNVDINMVGSDGKVNLSQLCSGSGGAGNSSVCLLKDISVNAINSKVGGGVTVEQQCSRCYKWQGVDGVPDEVAMKMPGKVKEDGTFQPPKGWVETSCAGGGIVSSRIRKYIVVALVVVALIILVLVALLVLVV